MTEHLSNVSDLLRRARLKCSQAETTLFHAFHRYLLKVADGCLDRRLRPKEDADDVVQQVWQEFFANVPEPQRIKDADHLQCWLATITRRRASDVNRHYLNNAIRNIRRECSLELSVQQDSETLSVGPRPYWGEDRDDLLFLQGHPANLSEAERICALLLWHGCCINIIAIAVGVSNKTVQRVLGDLAHRGGLYDAAAPDGSTAERRLGNAVLAWVA